MTAKSEVRQIELYAMDLVWSLAKVKYSTDIPMPSEIWNNRNKIDRRSKREIVDDLLNGLGGE
jgi:hypothetical protein